MSLLVSVQQLDRRIKGILRQFDVDKASRVEKEVIKQMKLACNEVKLDVRDYEYAETRA
jgi:predicted HAD superfamily phosphohydrolase YqeG